MAHEAQQLYELHSPAPAISQLSEGEILLTTLQLLPERKGASDSLWVLLPHEPFGLSKLCLLTPAERQRWRSA
jgi:hypothetical protein